VRKRVVAAVTLTMVLAAGLWFATVFRHAGDRLGSTRDSLAVADARLASSRASLAKTQRSRAYTDASTRSRRATALQVDAERVKYDALVAAARDGVASAQTSLDQTNSGRRLVDASATKANTCFAGVADALHASQARNGTRAVSALAGASNACAKTIALATGAQFPYDFPDPFVLRVGTTYYAYATNSGGGDIQVIRSTDLAQCDLVGNALPRYPACARGGATWAPSVLARDGYFVLYYTVRQAATNAQCISRAWAASPAGPYVDDSSGPLVCDAGGSIDASPFVDTNGQVYLLTKAVGDGGIWSRALDSSGLRVTGWPARLLGADKSWERGIVEAPSMFRAGGTYFLLYSPNSWESADYAIAYAACAGPTGPCLEPDDGRILRSDGARTGPGGAEVFTDASGSLHVAFHAYAGPDVGYPNSRYFHVAGLHIEGGRPVVDIPG
jgi:hypothetical protein